MRFLPSHRRREACTGSWGSQPLVRPAGFSSGDRRRRGCLPHLHPDQAAHGCCRGGACHPPSAPQVPQLLQSVLPAPEGWGHHQDGEGRGQKHSGPRVSARLLRATAGFSGHLWEDVRLSKAKAQPSFVWEEGQGPQCSPQPFAPFPSYSEPGWSKGLGRMGGAGQGPLL